MALMVQLNGNFASSGLCLAIAIVQLYIFPDKALELGIINSRHEAFITSKLWCNNAHHDLVLLALKTTLKKLGLDYLDLYLIHMPVRLKPEVDGVLEIGKDDLLPF
ncbi:hypothetical protein AHAS_Ahas19G0236800 [Arachis hypogaea]